MKTKSYIIENDSPSPDPDQYYRRLDKGEILLETDELYCRETFCWVRTSSAGRIVGEPSSKRTIAYRRSLTAEQYVFWSDNERAMRVRSLCNRPLGGKGLLSYRYKVVQGPSVDYIMIGAKDEADAMREAARSLTSEEPHRSRLEQWSPSLDRYVPVFAY